MNSDEDQVSSSSFKPKKVKADDCLNVTLDTDRDASANDNIVYAVSI